MIFLITQGTLTLGRTSRYVLMWSMIMKISFLVPGFVGRFPSAPIRGFQSKTTITSNSGLRAIPTECFVRESLLVQDKVNKSKKTWNVLFYPYALCIWPLLLPITLRAGWVSPGSMFFALTCITYLTLYLGCQFRLLLSISAFKILLLLIRKVFLLEKKLSGWEHVLLLQRSPVQFPALTLAGRDSAQ